MGREGGRESVVKTSNGDRGSRRESETIAETVAPPTLLPQPPSDPSPAPQQPIVQQAQPAVEHPPPPVPDNTPKTWANITKKNTAAAAAPPVMSAPAPVQPVVNTNKSNAVNNHVETEEMEDEGLVNGATNRSSFRPSNCPTGYVAREIFVGNVPVDMKEESLTEFFNVCIDGKGKVEQVRIRKPQAANPQASQIAFVTLSSQDAVEAILKDQKGPGDRLNKEMKHNGKDVELSITRVREQKPGGGGNGSRGGGSMRGMRGGMNGRGGGYGGPPYPPRPIPSSAPSTNAPSTNATRRFPSNNTARPQ